jgi:hypothetical protein
MTQLKRAQQAVAKLLKDPLDSGSLRELRYALDQAQNAPPLGFADGSLTPPVWASYTTLMNSLSSIQRVVNDLRSDGAL